MEFKQAKDIFASIQNMSISGLSSEKGHLLDELRHELYNAALEYAHIRADWFMKDFSARREMDFGRTVAHNAFIDNCNILSRHMGENGLDNDWRLSIGNNRKDIGDFACYMHLFLGIKSR